jgi:hypothetical protein
VSYIRLAEAGLPAPAVRKVGRNRLDPPLTRPIAAIPLLAFGEDGSVAKDLQKCQRLPLSAYTKRRLWSESGGYCQRPACAEFLFSDVGDVDFAQMAHIVAATTGGPRDVPVIALSDEERAHHSNIAVLCANCHTIVDKAPDNFPVALMREWKARHQEKLREALGTPEFETRGQARDYVDALLAQNRTIFNIYGPREGDFSEGRAALWRRHAVQVVVPNNAAVLRAVKQNRGLLSAAEREVADLFAIHALEFEARQVLGEWAAGSQTFPEGMDTIFEGDG